ncbi:MAG TPA: VOC family protein [Thermoleophilaceae bacterium]|nr:VOC family protein [Thermoleophilaceae bacterium]
MLQHVALELDPADRAAAERFWAILGFELVEPPPSLRERSSWLQRGSTQVHLLFADEPVAPPQGHAAVVAGDYEATLAELSAAGHEPDRREEHWGAPRAFVRSPGGHRVEVMAAPPGGAQPEHRPGEHRTD